jgi:hypothetical protein
MSLYHTIQMGQLLSGPNLSESKAYGNFLLPQHLPSRRNNGIYTSTTPHSVRVSTIVGEELRVPLFGNIPAAKWVA